MRTLVTGSNGFIGSHLVERLLREGWSVRCLVRRTSNLRWIKELDVELVFGEMFDLPSLQRAVDGVDVVFHLAGVTKGKSEQDYLRGNYHATRNLVDVCHAVHNAKFVLVSSQAAGGPSQAGQALTEEEAVHPISAYGRSKRMAEEIVLEFSKTHPATIIRPPSVYGPRDSDFLQLFRMIRKGVILRPGKGTQPISIVHVSDLVEGILAAATSEAANGELFFISHPKPVTFAELAQSVAKAMNVKTVTMPVPLALLKSVAAAGSLLGKLSGNAPLLNADKMLEISQPGWVCSTTKAEKVFGFKAQIDLATGLSETAQWYRQQGWL